jgi:putative spermidine/putrescine transport system ATP-binding protein
MTALPDLRAGLLPAWIRFKMFAAHPGVRGSMLPEAEVHAVQAPSEPELAVSLEGVVKRFGDVTAVDGIDLDVREGEFFSMLGPSGSGKTTCLRLIAGFEAPTEGRVLLEGRDVTDLAPYQRDVNTVFQDYALFPHMTVEENVEYGLKVKKVPKAERHRRVAEALGMVQLGEFGDRKPAELSGGQRQRVALARALVNRPKVLLLDEPLGALDPIVRAELQGQLGRLFASLGKTVVLVTHDLREAARLGDRITLMTGGRVVQQGTLAELAARPASPFVTEFLTAQTLGELRGAS